MWLWWNYLSSPTLSAARGSSHQRHYSSRQASQTRRWQTLMNASGNPVSDPAVHHNAVLLSVPCDNVPSGEWLFIKVVSHDHFDCGFIDHRIKPFAPLRQADTMRNHRFDFDSAAG